MNKFSVYILLFISSITFAQEVQFKAMVDKTTLGVNERLRVTFSINQDGDNFEAPDFAGFQVAFGPSMSTNFSWINGVKSFNRSYTYILQPKSQGTFTIKSATIDYEGEVYKTQPIKITVGKAIETPKDPNNPQNIADDGVILIADVSNANPYLSEPITVSYKALVSPNVGVNNIMLEDVPKFNGFWSQEIEVNSNAVSNTTYNGKQYKSVVLKKYVLYPQNEGKNTLEPLVINMNIIVPYRRNMGGMFSVMDYQNVAKTASAGSRVINVKKLPEEGKPESFTGAVGTFDFTVKPSKTELKSAESFDLVMSVSGNGNLKLFTLPKPEFPSAFEAFDPQHKEQIQTPASGMTGKISDTYTIIPQYKGKYTIKPVEFSYFDLKTKTYKTITSNPVEINVLQGKEQPVASNDKEESKQKIEKYNTFQFIKLKSDLQPLAKENFFGSTKFYTMLFAPFLLIPIIVLVRKKKEAIDADEFGNKVRQNTKLAKKFLSEAKKQLGSKVPFYMAMERAMHNFLKAKLHIETSEMSKENIQELLLEKQVNQETVTDFISLMNDCEFARYTPSSDVAMQKDYDRAVTLISDLQKQI